MLPKRATEKFVARKRYDYSFMKGLSAEQVEERKQQLPIRPPIWSKLRLEQKVAFLLGARYRRFLFNLETGTGKTLVALALVRYFQEIDCKCALVLVPNNVNLEEWSDEVAKHAQALAFAQLKGSTAQKWETLKSSGAKLVVATYAGVFHMCCDKVASKKGGMKLQPSERKVRELCALVDGLIMDESTVVQNKSALPFRICRQIVKSSSFAFALTGTPFGRDPTALWGQMFLIDDGWSLGETLALFRSAFFTAKDNFWGSTEYTFKSSKTALLHKFIAHRSIRYDADESTLPQLTHIIKEVSLPEDAATYYERTKQALIEAQGNFREMKNSFVRLRQISSGFIGYHDDEIGVRAEIEFTQNQKLASLISLLSEIDSDYKVLVFHDFIFSGSIIERELVKAGISHVRLGRKSNPENVLRTFKNDRNCRVLILSTAGAFGLNLQMSRYGIFYESPVSVIIRKQMIARFHRQGSDHSHIFLYDLITKGTYDRKILEFHQAGKNLFDAIIAGV